MLQIFLISLASKFSLLSRYLLFKKDKGESDTKGGGKGWQSARPAPSNSRALALRSVNSVDSIPEPPNALDDMDLLRGEGALDNEHFVRTDPDIGLVEDDAERAAFLLLQESSRAARRTGEDKARASTAMPDGTCLSPASATLGEVDLRKKTKAARRCTVG